MRRANFDPGWIAMLFSTAALVIMIIDRGVVQGNTSASDALRREYHAANQIAVERLAVERRRLDAERARTTAIQDLSKVLERAVQKL